jgi:hypothetical protein
MHKKKKIAITFCVAELIQAATAHEQNWVKSTYLTNGTITIDDFAYNPSNVPHGTHRTPIVYYRKWSYNNSTYTLSMD